MIWPLRAVGGLILMVAITTGLERRESLRVFCSLQRVSKKLHINAALITIHIFQKQRNHVFINLKCRVIEWLGSKGKTHIQTTSFARDIAKTVSKLAYLMPSYHGEGYGRTYTPTLTKKKTAIEYLVNFLIERKKAVDANPNLIVVDRLTQSTVWYRIRPFMMADYDKGIFKPKKSWGDTRRYLTKIIDDLCQGELLYQGEEIFPRQSLSREDLGIFAAAKGMMLYKGESYPVSIDNIKKIADKGIAVWAVEKEGIPNIIAPFTAEYGIALVTSGGRFTKYIKQLIENVRHWIGTTNCCRL